MTKPIINIDELELQSRPPEWAPQGDTASRYDMQMGFISAQIGARQLGYNLTVVPPGKRAFPYHNHRVNEEMFFILDGTGEVRIGEERYPIRAGDVIACPAGGKETAHQIINTGTTELRYLAVSTERSPEIAEYPDSGKFAVLAQFSSNNQGDEEIFRFVGRPDQMVDYWEGE